MRVLLFNEYRPLGWLDADVAATPASRAQGLAGSSGLPPGRAMLFAFPRDVQDSFWMVGMRFPIDVVFVDRTQRIVHVARNVLPGRLDLIASPVPYRYVLELPGGWWQMHIPRGTATVGVGWDTRDLPVAT